MEEPKLEPQTTTTEAPKDNGAKVETPAPTPTPQGPPVREVPKLADSKVTSTSELPKPNTSSSEFPKVQKLDEDGYAPKHKSLVNNPLFADVTLIVGKKNFYAHNCVLFGRCPHLYQKAAAKAGKKKSIVQVELPKETKDSVLLAFLGYVYTDHVDFTKLSVNEILLLNQMAMDYESKRLQWLCENHMNESFSNQNIYPMLVEAEKVQQKRVKQLCFQYVVAHYNEVINNKEGVQVIGVLLLQESITVYTQHTTGTLERLDIGPCPPSTIVEDYKQIYRSIDSSNAVAEVTPFKINKSAAFVSCHKPILAAQTAQLANLCNSAVVKEKSGEYILVSQVKTKLAPEITSEAFESLLKFVYYGESAVPPLHAVELVTFSFEYGMLELNKLCYEIISKNINTKTALPILGVTYLEISPLEVLTSDLKDLVKNIKRTALFYIHNNIKQIDLKPLKKMNPHVAVDIVLVNQPEALDEEPEPVAPPQSGSIKGKPVDKSRSKSELNVTPVKSPEVKKEEPKKDAATPDPKSPSTPKKDDGKLKKEPSKAEIGKRESDKEEPKKEEPKKEEPKKEEPKKEESPVEDEDDKKSESGKKAKKEKKDKKDKKSKD